MILLVDADSLIFASCYRAKEKNNQEKYYTKIQDSIHKFDEQFMKIINNLEEVFDIEEIR